MRLAVIGAAVATAVLPWFAYADPHVAQLQRHHNAISRRASSEVVHHKREVFNNARFTFYDVGLGACGKYNQPGDFIVALTAQQFGDGYPGPNQCCPSH
ncbi:hypothetical protein BXZ70DRAFT_281371 [Cristinia sonorae]|uniref:Uncharacterized protein n=1 Tax=Cristinia sonorae TaxID=1940300 RepID=A0A8K0XUM1_9AGAR|nr:hypothetical protein BXZ70DRAFT_281371 [Cristinia sonorae]